MTREAELKLLEEFINKKQVQHVPSKKNKDYIRYLSQSKRAASLARSRNKAQRGRGAAIGIPRYMVQYLLDVLEEEA